MIRDATPADYPGILALNLESEHVLAPLGPERLAWLHAVADRLRVAELDGAVVAFLLALREGTEYESPNYRYFAGRYDTFLYVDRIVVAAAHQGRGVGAALYDDLFAHARRTGTARVTCEIDAIPPNEASRRFHARYGFRELDRQWVADGRKQVSLQEAPVPVFDAERS
jgi:predicted GNAT superfamily acetyltransferase